jgi:hypothetical protein
MEESSSHGPAINPRNFSWRFKWAGLILILAIGLVFPSLNRAVQANAPAALSSTDYIYSVADATVKSAQATVNFGTATTLDVRWGGDAEPVKERAVILFDLSHIPAEAVIDQATLSLTLLSASGDKPVSVSACNVQDSWRELTVNWNNQPTVPTFGLCGSTTVATTLQPYTWDVTSIARAWHAGPNYGLKLGLTESGTSAFWRSFGSLDGKTYAPMLEVTYSIPTITPTPTRTSTSTLPPTTTRTPTRTPTATISQTATRTPTLTPTRTSTATFSQTATRTPTRTPTLTTPTRTPTLTPTTTQDLSGQYDSWVDQDATTVNHGSGTTLTVAARMGDLDLIHKNALLWFKVNTLPAYTYISNAQLELYQFAAIKQQNDTLRIEALNAAFDEMHVTWANQPAHTDIGIPPADLSPAAGWKTWDLTNQVRNWALNPSTNFGLAVINALPDERSFSSREGSQPPRLTISTGTDGQSPGRPATIWSLTHTGGQWSNRLNVIMAWDAAQDFGSAGIRGYSAIFNQDYATPAPEVFSTADTQAVLDLSGEGTWYFHIKAVDWAGNWSADKVWGAIYIDTHAPANPAITSSTHTPGVWSNNPDIALNWSGAADGTGSGVSGYSILFSSFSTIEPDTTADTTNTSGVFNRPDGTMYFHLRTVDAAGNWSAAVHFGPLKIDTLAPTCSLGALPVFAGIPFSVQWSAVDNGSPIAAYDLQYQPDAGAWIGWQTGVVAQAGSFTGERGHTYGFRCRARDQAGNQGAYPSAALVSTRVGRELDILVKSGSYSTCPNAQVYRSGDLLGTTDSGGYITSNFVQGDTLAVLCPIYEKTGVKRPENLAWVVYATNVDIPNSGLPQLFRFGDMTAASDPTQIYVSSYDPVIGFRVMFSVEWDAPASYLENLRQAAESASNFLYDVTDGQMFFEYIDILDNAMEYDRTDYKVQLDNQTWPSANVGGILFDSSSNYRIWIGRLRGKGNLAGSKWTDAFATMVHEFGHYGLGLYDEYLNRAGKDSGSCATNFDTQVYASASSIMNSEFWASELCSNVDSNHKHNTDTQQDLENKGENTWETVLRVYQAPDTWHSLYSLQSPDTRGAIVPGPDALPGRWIKSSVQDNDTGACTEFTVTVRDQAGTPVSAANAWLDQAGGRLMEGLTDKFGSIVIFSAHNGETLWVEKDGASASLNVSCSPGSAAGWIFLTITPPAFNLEVVASVVAENLLDVTVRPSEPLQASPNVIMELEINKEPLAISMTYDPLSGLYRGQSALPSGAKFLLIQAADTFGHTILRLVKFTEAPAAAGEMVDMSTGNHVFRIIFPAGSLSADTFLTIQTSSSTNAPVQAAAAAPDNLLRVGEIYRVTAASGQTSLNLPAALSIQFPVDLGRVNINSLQIRRWIPALGAWVTEFSTINAVRSSVSAQVSNLGTFALFGEPYTPTIYLPVIVRPH